MRKNWNAFTTRDHALKLMNQRHAPADDIALLTNNVGFDVWNGLGDYTQGRPAVDYVLNIVRNIRREGRDSVEPWLWR